MNATEAFPHEGKAVETAAAADSTSGGASAEMVVPVEVEAAAQVSYGCGGYEGSVVSESTVKEGVGGVIPI